ncbi:hypothetical protein [Saccharothrix yanglingensis]|uniref:hypothetical protein n=1 Tax=Saccharothrix yanglingensis TaxID=659496 RepID=UPI0027D2A770|nr:hypothetical protein [Saccharothrix yanglingensis]
MSRTPTPVVTGAAAAGKSTVRRTLARDPGSLALDGDVMAAGAAAVSGGRADYPAFRRSLPDIAGEVGGGWTWRST